MFSQPIGPPQMLEIINGIEPEAWAGLAGLLGGVATAVVVVSKGLKKSPPEVGTSKPEADMTDYVLLEVRGISRRLDELHDDLQEIDRRTEGIHQHTSVLIDRR